MWQVRQGDCVDAMRGMDERSVQTVVTSPPYWGLRDYGVEGQLGLERVPDCGQNIAEYRGCTECYVCRLLDVFRAVRRVLREDGTVWLNLGDSYGGERTTGRNDTDRETPGGRGGSFRDSTRTKVARLKPKNLVGIPWRVAFALQADGWYLRSDIIWAKPNPMPESVTDRPTKSHEYVFLLSKSARYFWDADAVREPNIVGSTEDAPRIGDQKYLGQGPRTLGTNGQLNPAGRNMRSVWNIATEPFPGAHFATFPKKLVEPCVKAGSSTGDTVLDPFCGSGTVGLVSLRLGRHFVGIELNPEYAEMARDRIVNDAPLFNTQGATA